MLQKEYILNGNNRMIFPAVVKIQYGKSGHYVIAKCKTVSTTLRMIENSLNAFIRGGKNNPGGIYYYLFNFIKDNPGLKFKVTTLVESENGYDLLVREQEELDKGIGNPLFLNNQTTSYVPAFDEEKETYGWLTKNEVMNYNRFMKSRKKSIKKKKDKAIK